MLKFTKSTIFIKNFFFNFIKNYVDPAYKLDPHADQTDEMVAFQSKGRILLKWQNNPRYYELVQKFSQMADRKGGSTLLALPTYCEL